MPKQSKELETASLGLIASFGGKADMPVSFEDVRF
jgi:hypothetical protein